MIIFQLNIIFFYTPIVLKVSITMKSTGIIVEYNPMHNGHIHHLQETKKMTNADVIIAIMSGNFLQRGEPALLPKYTRAEIALNQGVDIVIELPYPFATQKAEIFANGAISLLKALQVDQLVFGSESGNIEDLQTLSTQNQQLIQENIKSEMKKGVSYPKALSSILALQSDISLPNNILGMHYIEAINRQQANIFPKTIIRTGSQYHDETITGQIASATSIRKSLIQNHYSMQEITNTVPDYTFSKMEQYFKSNNLFHHWELYFPFLQYQVLSSTNLKLEKVYEAEEGLENRLISAMKESTSFDELMSKLKTKRYTWNRLQRLCLHTLLDVTKENMLPYHTEVPFIRLLGMTSNGQQYLSSIKKEIQIPIVANTKSHTHPLIELEKKATAVYYSVLPSEQRIHAIRNEWFHQPIIIK